MAEAANTVARNKDIFVRLPNGNEELNGSSSERITDDGFQEVQRKRKRKKRKINIIGDSIARSITKVVKCSEQGSNCMSLKGAGIKQIVEQCEQRSEEVEDDSLMVIQGGGNSLKWLGEEMTVESILQGIKKIKRDKKDMKLAVISILPRPRENAQYEQMRKATNRHLRSEVCKLKADFVKNKKGSVSYLDIDSVVCTESRDVY